MPRCKIGDLAIIKAPLSFDIYGNNGKIVEVLRLATASEIHNWGHTNFGDGTIWFIRSAGSCLNSNFGIAFQEAPYQDKYLVPICNPGNPLDEERIVEKKLESALSSVG